MTSDRLRSILAWHVHGSWIESFVSGGHRYLIPLNAAGDAHGRGLCGRNWPAAQEVSLDRLREEDVDLVVLQRPEEIELVERFLGRRLGIDVPAVYVEHNAPRPYAVDAVHPLAERCDIPVVHVTDYNRLMWDTGIAPTRVITHGIADPGNLFSPEIGAAATMINEPIRRWRTVGTDLLAKLSTHVPIDVWGIGSAELNIDGRLGAVQGRGDVGHPQVLHEIARRHVYVHTARWTSLGLSLLEAMFVGMPIVAVGTTQVPMVVPADAGVVSADVEELGSALRRYVNDPSAAAVAGKAAREYALVHFGLHRFLTDWDRLIAEFCR